MCPTECPYRLWGPPNPYQLVQRALLSRGEAVWRWGWPLTFLQLNRSRMNGTIHPLPPIYLHDPVNRQHHLYSTPLTRTLWRKQVVFDVLLTGRWMIVTTVDNLSLLGCYTMPTANYLPTFRRRISSSGSRKWWWRWGQYDVPKRRLSFTSWHSVTSRKTWILTF